MKKQLFVLVSLLSLTSLTSCASTSSYTDRRVNIFRRTNVVDKQFSVRFYEEQPHVPYVEVGSYFKEFFNTTFFTRKDKSVYKYYNSSTNYLGFDVKNQTFSSNALSSFDHHPDFGTATGKNFIKGISEKTTNPQERIISLKSYQIPIYEHSSGVYVPLTFLSKIAGGSALYNVAYNGKDIYVIDRGGQLGTPVDYSSFGNAYYSLINDLTNERPSDLAKYAYNELCFVWDNLRGYTSQLVIGDNNLVSIGLDGTLSQYLPSLKEYLTSTNKHKYYIGYYTLFQALNDGGHTKALASFADYNQSLFQEASEIEEFSTVIKTASLKDATKALNLASYIGSKQAVFEYNFKNGPHNYYQYDSDTKTSYIGFDSFEFDFSGWDNYYSNHGEVPVSTDTFAYVRSKLYEAKNDGAENVVLDLTTNGGGAVASLIGLIGLFNEAKSFFSMNDVFNRSKTTDEYLIDINLDGKCDNKDKEEAQKFTFNVGVLTSEYSFSCGNLFPSVMKELGYKIIGAQSGGGSCTISYESTADGLPYVRSTYNCLSNANGENIDGGVPVDLEIEKLPFMDPMFDASNFYDANVVGTYLKTAYVENAE